MENVGKRIESQNSQTPQTDPDSTENEGHEGRRNGEEVNESVEMEHEDQLVVGSDESHEEVGNEEHVEYEVKLKCDECICLWSDWCSPEELQGKKTSIFPAILAEHHRSRSTGSKC